MRKWQEKLQKELFRHTKRRTILPLAWTWCPESRTQSRENEMVIEAEVGSMGSNNLKGEKGRKESTRNEGMLGPGKLIKATGKNVTSMCVFLCAWMRFKCFNSNRNML